MTGGTIQWSDIGSTREAAADDAARRYDRVCRESPKTTDTHWSAGETGQNGAVNAIFTQKWLLRNQEKHLQKLWNGVEPLMEGSPLEPL